METTQADSYQSEQSNPSIAWEEARTSSYSQDVMCVEVAPGEGMVGFQDSKEAGMSDRARLIVSATAARTLFEGIRAGKYDLDA